MINERLVVDAVVHPYNLAPDNQNPAAQAQLETVYAAHVLATGADHHEHILTREEFFTDFSFDALESESKACGHSWSERFDYDVGGFRQAKDRLTSERALDVDRGAPLVAVDRLKHGGFGTPERREAARRIAVNGAFDLDDVGSHVREDETRERTRDVLTQVENAQAVIGLVKLHAGHPSSKY